jgi:hypothetical protein
MRNIIEFNFDTRINGYVVTMPDFVTLDMIEEWKDWFDRELQSIRSLNKFALLFDTNKHNFESIQCLKILREYLTDNKVLKSRFSRAALVAPAKFMAPNIKSEVEAYFDNLEEAYKWLKE